MTSHSSSFSSENKKEGNKLSTANTQRVVHIDLEKSEAKRNVCLGRASLTFVSSTMEKTRDN